jgi:hypothetical protein
MMKTYEMSPDFWMCKHYNGFAREAQFASNDGRHLADKNALEPAVYYGPKAIAKEGRRAYTPCPHLPPLTIKVSQVEMEAGDCEGRLPPLFLPEVRGQISGVSQYALA